MQSTKITPDGVWVAITDRLPPTEVPILGWDQYWEEARVYLYGGKTVDGCDAWSWMIGHEFRLLQSYEQDWYPTHWMIIQCGPSQQAAEEIFQLRRNAECRA